MDLFAGAGKQIHLGRSRMKICLIETILPAPVKCSASGVKLKKLKIFNFCEKIEVLETCMVSWPSSSSPKD